MRRSPVASVKRRVSPGFEIRLEDQLVERPIVIDVDGLRQQIGAALVPHVNQLRLLAPSTRCRSAAASVIVSDGRASDVGLVTVTSPRRAACACAGGRPTSVRPKDRPYGAEERDDGQSRAHRTHLFFGR